MKKFKKVLSIFLIIIMVLSQELNILAANASAEVTNESSNSTSISQASVENENISVVVTFSTMGGTISESTKTVTYGNTYGTLSTPMKEGYTFDGWYTSEIDGSHITETSIVEQQSIHTLYAHWNPIKVNIYFNGNGSILEETNKEVSFGIPYGDLPTPSLEDFNFIGWYTLPSGGILVTSDSIVNITSSVMLYARWSGDTINVTLNPNGGTVSVTNKQVNYGDVYGTLPIPVRDGYQFKGWYSTSNTEDIFYETSMVKYDVDHTLYALWSQNYYSVILSSDGGDVSPDNKVIRMGDMYGTLPTPTKKGYIFLGWFTSSSLNAEQVTSTDVFNEADSTILYSHWKANEHTVHLKGNGVYLSKTSIIVTYGGTYGELPVPSMENYTFHGWYTNPTYGTLINTYSEVKTTPKKSCMHVGLVMNRQ